MRRITAWALFFSLLLTGCTKVGTQAPGSANPWTHHGVLRFASLGEPDTLDTELTNYGLTIDISMFWAGYLFNVNDKNELFPELATEEPTLANGGISKDELSITYKLRRGVKWHDGAPFGADDVIFSWHAVMNPKNNVQSRVGYDLVDHIDKIDDATIRIKLKRRWAPFVNSFFTMSGTPFAILPAHLLANLPDINHIPYNDHPIGTGPFKVVEWKRNNVIRFEANPDYWRGPPKLKAVEYRIIPNDNTIVTQLRTHEIDMYYNASSNVYPQLKNIPGTRVYLTPFTQFSQIQFNNAKILHEKALRQALAYATDRRAIAHDIAHDAPIAADSDQPPFSWAYNPNVRKYNYDPGRARAILDAAGWKTGPDGVRSKDGRRLQLDVANVAGSATGNALSVLLQAEWRAIGVESVIKNYSSSLYFAGYQAGGIIQSGKFDVGYLSWINGIDPDDSALFMCDQFPPNGQNAYRYCNPALDGYERAALSHVDRATRKKAYAAIQSTLAEDQPLIVQYFARRIDVVNTDLKNYKPAHVVTMFWNSWELDI